MKHSVKKVFVTSFIFVSLLFLPFFVADTHAYQDYTDASVVVGQPALNFGNVNQGGAASSRTLFTPSGVASDGKRFFVADCYNNRVLIYNTIPTSNNASVDVVIGQSDFTSNGINQGGTVNANTLACPMTVDTDGTRLFVSDTINNRVLIYNTIPTSNNASADIVIGQSNFTSNGVAFSISTFQSPWGAVYDKDSGKLIITAGNRVHIYNSVPSSNGAPANVIVGRATSTDNACPGAAQNLACTVGTARVFNHKLFLVDRNNRIMIWNSIPTTDGAPADVIIGQPDFTSGLANQGGSPAANTLSHPADTAWDGKRLYVLDSGNNRILVYNGIPTSNNTSAIQVIGQANFTSSSANRGVNPILNALSSLPIVGDYKMSNIVTVNGTPYFYLIGGRDNATTSSTVYRATINADATLSTFSTNTALPQALWQAASMNLNVGGTNYLYLIGGRNGSNTYQTTVYRAAVDTSGNIGSWSTSGQGQLVAGLCCHTQSSFTMTVGGTTYMYIVGGRNPSGVPVSTVYRATVDGSGNIGSWSTSGQGQLPTASAFGSAVTATVNGTTYVYMLGGTVDNVNAVKTVYRAAIDGSGNIGAWSSTNQAQLSQATMFFTAVSVNNSLYIFGGAFANPGLYYRNYYNNVYRGKIDTSGNITEWNASAQDQLPQVMQNQSISLFNNGSNTYIFSAGGYFYNASNIYLNDVFRATISNDSVHDFTSSRNNLVSNGLSVPSTNVISTPIASMYFINNMLMVTDTYNNRVLFFNTAPVLLSIGTSVTDTTATIQWNTDTSTTTKVNYGLDSGYGSTTAEIDTSPMSTTHSVTLTNLLPCHTYHFQAISYDSDNNRLASSDQTFTTKGECTGFSGTWKDSNGNDVTFDSLGGDNVFTNDTLPTFSFTQASDTNNGISKYQIIVTSVDKGDMVYLDDIQPTSNTSTDTFEDDTRWEQYNTDRHTITVRSKDESHRLTPGAYRWKVRAVNSKGASIETSSKILRVQTQSAIFSSSLAFPLTLLQAGNKTNINISTQNILSIPTKPLSITTTTPTFYGITNVGAHVKLTLVKHHDSENYDDTYSFTTDANAESRYGINVTPALPMGTYNLTLSATNDSGDYVMIPSFTITIGASPVYSTGSITSNPVVQGVSTENTKTVEASLSPTIEPTRAPSKEVAQIPSPSLKKSCFLWVFCK